jgi:energy-coupling factor transporter ATP-binding protein EcfA2
LYKLISLTIGNYRSFSAPQTLSLDGRGGHSVTAVFGPNAGGKSNIAKALVVLVNSVRRSSDPNFRLPYEPFLLNAGMDQEPMSLGVAFTLDGKRYEYSVSFTAKKVMYEVLREQSSKNSRMNLIFERTSEGLNPYAKQYGFGKRLLERTRPDTLVITKGREDNNEYSNIVFGLLDHITIVAPSSDAPTPLFVDMLKNNAGLRTKTLELLKRCDFSIRDIKFTDVALPEDFFDKLPVQLPTEVKRAMVEQGSTFTTVHAVRDEEQTIVGSRELDFWSQESMGTQKFFEAAVPIIDALENEKTIFIDEFGTYIHPTLVHAIISLFGESDSKAAYMILTTHGTSMLRELSRNEIVLVEKNHAEESVITPLRDLGVRDGEAFEKRYLAGFYGGIPIIEG